MIRAKHTHYLAITDPRTQPADVPLLVLYLESRGGRVVAGAECREHRDELAGLVGSDVLAELLGSDRPIRVTGVTNGYRIEEV